MAKKTLFKGRPDFPNEEPQKILSGATTNDTDEVYCIDTLGQAVTLASGMQKIADDGTKSASDWVSTSVTGVLYGRWSNVGGTDGTLACYVVDVANSES
jgi:hypothetical protein